MPSSVRPSMKKLECKASLKKSNLERKKNYESGIPTGTTMLSI